MKTHEPQTPGELAIYLQVLREEIREHVTEDKAALAELRDRLDEIREMVKIASWVGSVAKWLITLLAGGGGLLYVLKTWFHAP